MRQKKLWGFKLALILLTKDYKKVAETALSDKENKIISKLAFDLLTETAIPSIKSLVAKVDH